jgi:hypothetical protein
MGVPNATVYLFLLPEGEELELSLADEGGTGKTRPTLEAVDGDVLIAFFWLALWPGDGLGDVEGEMEDTEENDALEYDVEYVETEELIGAAPLGPAVARPSPIPLEACLEETGLGFFVGVRELSEPGGEVGGENVPDITPPTSGGAGA